MESEVLKNEAMCWLRYGKRMPIVCTEAGRWNADVLGVSPSECIEVEVKVSKADLRNEFINKSGKHFLYANATSNLTFVPNRFYFMLPSSLQDTALAIINEKAPKAGLIVYLPEGNLLDGRNCAVVKPAEKLRDGKPSRRVIRVAMMRMSSELCGTKKLAYNALRDLATNFRFELSRITTAAVRSAGTLDFENRPEALENRAAELALCVDGFDWKQLTDEQKTRWREAAKRLLEAQYLDLDAWELEL